MIDFDFHEPIDTGGLYSRDRTRRELIIDIPDYHTTATRPFASILGGYVQMIQAVTGLAQRADRDPKLQLDRICLFVLYEDQKRERSGVQGSDSEVQG